jgi:hypothetical protein
MSASESAADAARTARPYRARGPLVDLPGQIVALAEGAGLALVERQVG